MNLERNSFTSITKKDGLPDNVIKSILEDENSNLWIGTNRGFSKYNPNTKIIKNYSISDGLPSDEFNFHACLLSKSGKLYFGSPKGFISFFPDRIMGNKTIPKIVFTNFYIFNKPVSINGENSSFRKHINESDRIILSYKQSVFTIKYAALNFISPEKNQYAYKLEGFDKDWSYVGNDRKATYTNLDPGEYVFRVKASNNDEVWNEEGISILIIITPPFWQTWWFRAFTVLVLISLLYSIHYIRVMQIEKLNKTLKYKVDQRTKEINRQHLKLQQQTDKLYETNAQLEERQQQVEKQSEELKVKNEALSEVNAVKDKLFSIVAHDLKSPFNILIGFSELLKSQYDNFDEEKRKNFINKIHGSSERVFGLLENLLAWSRAQQGQIQFSPTLTDLADLLKQNIDLVFEQASKKYIKIQLNNFDPNREVMLDSDLINTIMRNLLTNAIKFSEEKSKILITSSLVNDMIIISVKDSGIGISEEDQKKLFKKNYNFTSFGTNNEKGTGIGLILCKDFVEKHGGVIEFESELGIGSEFKITLPNIKAKSKK